MRINRKKIRQFAIRWGILLILMALFALFVIRLNQETSVTPLVETEGRTFEKGIVEQVLTDNLQEDGTRVGEQRVAVRMTTGVLRGQVVNMTSSAGYLFGTVCQPGMHVIVLQTVLSNNQSAGTSLSGPDISGRPGSTASASLSSVYSRDRGWIIAAWAAFYLLCLVLIGGKQGFKGAIGLLFTILTVIFFIMPMIYRGYSPILSAVLACGITTFVTMYWIGGPAKKTCIASLGTVLGCIMAALTAELFGLSTGLSGWNVSDIESLLDLWYVGEVKVGELFFAGILISALGATMDVTMSIASSMEEIVRQNPRITRRELFHAGMRVGSDMMGTDSNTLILAFAGTSLSTLVLDYAYQLPLLQIINSNNIGLSIMQGLAGSFGVISCVPITVLISSFWYLPRRSLLSVSGHHSLE